MPRTKNDYKPYLVAMMSHLDGRTYSQGTQFSREQLLRLKPVDIVRWMNFKTFGVDDPPIDANPTHARSSSILYWKKAISSFMPCRLPHWNEESMSGNPTKSQEVNDLITRVRKKEVRKQGVESKARRPLTEGEFRQVQIILRESPENGHITWYGIPGFVNFLSHMIARPDCVSQWKKELLEPHDVYPEFAVKAQLSWAKNVQQEGDAPWQIVLGSRDPFFCVFIGLAIWLEFFLSSQSGPLLTPYVFAFTTDTRVPKGGEATNDYVREVLTKLYASSEFVRERGGLLGAYSIRKFGSTRARRGGASKDEKDYRGRWKKNRRVSDVYDDAELPYPDGKVAALLCPGGPCSYRIKTNSCVTNDWILDHVVPSIAGSVYGRTLATILGKALLWVIFSDKKHWVPPAIVARVTDAYRELVGEEDTSGALANPVEKKLLVVTGDDATLVITEINATPAAASLGVSTAPAPAQDNNVEGQAPIPNDEPPLQQPVVLGGHTESQTSRQLLHTIVNQLNTIQSSMSAMAESIVEGRETDRAMMQSQFRIVHSNMRRISQEPLRLLRRAIRGNNQQNGNQRNNHANNNNENNAPVYQNNFGGNGAGGAVLAGGQPLGEQHGAENFDGDAVGVANPLVLAELSPTPRNLYTLWEEYMVGIGGRKPARMFSRQERGRCKHKYHRRKIVWDRIALLINAGLTSHMACDRIYDVYGHGATVTTIINALKKDIRENSLDDRLRV